MASTVYYLTFNEWLQKWRYKKVTILPNAPTYLSLCFQDKPAGKLVDVLLMVSGAVLTVAGQELDDFLYCML